MTGADDLAVARFRLLRPHLEDGVPLARWRAKPRDRRGPPSAGRGATGRGLAGLARRSRADRGSPASFPPLRELIEGLALQTPPPTVARPSADRRRAPPSRAGRPPSYAPSTADRADLDPALVTLAHEGGKAYRDAFDLVHRREAGRPNAIWQADHTPLDIWVLRRARAARRGPG